MNKHLMEAFVAILISLIIISCSEATDSLEEAIPEKPSNVQVISVDEAMGTLTSFMNDMGLVKTKSGESRAMGSVEVHYSSKIIDGNPVPDAYLVNFENNAGFAVLGANSDITPIIAVTESGSMDWNTLMSANVIDSEKRNRADTTCIGIEPDEMMSICVNAALKGRQDNDSDLTKSGPYTTEILPLTSGFNFGQNRTYCHKNNRGFVTSGCAATALSIAVAYNQFPQMRVDYELLDFDDCNTNDGSGIRFLFDDGHDVILKVSDYFYHPYQVPSNLDRAGLMHLLELVDENIFNVHSFSGNPVENYSFLRTRYKLTSAMFYVLDNIIKSWDATGTMPAAVEDGLEELGYTNVSRTKKSSLTSDQITNIRDMLSSNKPVIMCGWSLFSLSQSHYWIVDGIRISANETLVHCNWGWNGTNNGWFSSDCIRVTDGVSYDDNGQNVARGNTTNGWGNLIVYKYNKGTSTTPYDISYHAQNNRVSYVQ